MGAKAMNTTEIRKLIKGPIATVPTPFDHNHEIDYGRMAELTEMWVENVHSGRGMAKMREEFMKEYKKVILIHWQKQI